MRAENKPLRIIGTDVSVALLEKLTFRSSGMRRMNWLILRSSRNKIVDLNSGLL